MGWDAPLEFLYCWDDHGMDGMGSFCSEATTLKKEELHHELDLKIN
jgi:hypothetical protein